jgi:hypothetical protein
MGDEEGWDRGLEEEALEDDGNESLDEGAAV